MPENSNNFNGDDEPLRSKEGSDDDRLRDASTSDAAAENARESERIQEAARAAVPAYQLDDDKLKQDDEGRATGENTKKGENERPLTVQGSEEEIEENFSGSTNLTLDQLKKEGDPGGYGPEGPEPEEEERF